MKFFLLNYASLFLSISILLVLLYTSKTCYCRLHNRFSAGPTDERYVTGGGGVRAGVTLCDRGRGGSNYVIVERPLMAELLKLLISWKSINLGNRFNMPVITHQISVN